jgi:hypothetical protein
MTLHECMAQEWRAHNMYHGMEAVLHLMCIGSELKVEA